MLFNHLCQFTEHLYRKFYYDATILSVMSSRHKIMVVDDEFDILQIIRRYLEKWGFSVITFSNPLLALQQFKDDPKAYSVVLLDIRMPELSGVALAAMMQKVKPDVKLIIMTAFEIFADDLKFSLPLIKNNNILHKPFKLIEICTAVKKQLQIVH